MLESVFSISGGIAMLGWAGLLLLPGVDFVVKVLARAIIPATIGIVYSYLLLSNMAAAPADGSFGSLAGVKSLFTVDALLLAGWIHYLAFDLFVGSWEVEDARARGIHHLIVVPCLLLTFMAGPAGLLVYLVIRQAASLLPGRPAAA